MFKIKSFKHNTPILRHIPGPKTIKKKLKRRFSTFYQTHLTRQYADDLYYEIFGYHIDWKNPRDLNEKINYLAFKTDTRQWSLWADKYAVREYVRSKGLGHILVPLYGKWDDANDIDWQSLPQQCVLKANNGSGDAIIIKDKATCNEETIKEQLNHSLHTNFGIKTAEPHYLRIKPCIIAEKLLQPTDGSPLVDYKVWCFHGKPYSILTVSERNNTTNQYKLALYNLNWERIQAIVANNHKNNLPVERPVHLNQMLNYATILSEDIPEVRVDFYEIDEQVYFGEMTMTSAAGRMTNYTKECLLEMGNQINLDIVRKK